MWRIGLSLLAFFALAGCSQFQTAEEFPCSDCLPPPIAGKYFYHRRIDTLVTKLTAQNSAKRDIGQIDCEPSRDFRDGFTQAYIDLAVGRPPCVPTVPPKKYWHAFYRSCAGYAAVEEWYAGYRVGLDNGVNGGVSRFNRVVLNPDGGCVSAAYINPYATPMAPSGVIPVEGQTIPTLAEEDQSIDGSATIPASATEVE